MSFISVSDFETALWTLVAPDEASRAAAAARQAQLTKPAGSLGRLEDIALFFAAWQGRERPALNHGRAVVFAGNHGVTAHGISAYPAEVTAQMVANFKAGGAAINALAGAARLELKVVSLDLDRPTADFTAAPAMTETECLAAMTAGAETVEAGLDVLVIGEMGIGNSTSAAALCSRSFGGDAQTWVGPGTGVNAEGVRRKIAVVDAAMRFHADAPHTAFETLCRVGGREHAAMAGAVLRARQLRVPVILDGFICCAALAPLVRANPAVLTHCIAGHCSAEPGHARLLEQFGLPPLLSLGMRLGEGSGAAVAAALVRSALLAHANMATYGEAGVANS